MPSRVIFYLGFYFSLCLGAYAQQNEIDSLESLARSVPADTNKVWILNHLVNALREKDNLKALGYAEEAKELSEVLNYKRGLGPALENLGWILYRTGDYTKSFDVSTKALKLNEALGNKPAVARCFISIAAIHYEQKQYIKAIENFKKAHEVAITIEDTRTMARSQNNIGYSYLQFGKVDSAFYYANLALNLGEKVNDSYMIAFSRRTLGDVYLIRKEPNKALANFEACLAISDKIDNTFLKVSTLHRLGKFYNEKGQYEKALVYLFRNIELTLKFGYKEELEKTYKLVAEAYDAQKDIPKAYEYQTKYLMVHDSLYDQRQSEQIALMQAISNAEIKETQIQLLTKETQLKQEELNSQKVWSYFFIGCLSLFIILAVVLLYNNRYVRIAKKELEKKNKAINDQAQELRNLNSTKDKLFSIISHDLRSPLASLRAIMELVATAGLTQEEFVSITIVLKKNIDTVHQDLDNLLMWAQTQLKGLQASPELVELKLLADEKISLFREVANTKEISIINNIDHQVLAFADRNHISLVFRNLIANAIKFNEHGGSIRISSQDIGGQHEVSVTDSGVGISNEDIHKLFNAETHFTRPGTNQEKGVGIGLLLTKEFIETNNGVIRVASELGKGTTFTFTLKASQEDAVTV